MIERKWFVIWQAGHAGPRVFTWGPQQLENPLDLVIHVTAWEERTPGVGELCEDAARTPHVNAGGVQLGPEQDVRGAIPECDHLGAVTSHRDPEGPGQTKVCKFQLPILVDQKILRFEISVKNIVSMAVIEASQ